MMEARQREILLAHAEDNNASIKCIMPASWYVMKCQGVWLATGRRVASIERAQDGEVAA